MIDIRITLKGTKVRLRGFGNRKLINLRVLQTGIEAIKGRLEEGIGGNDQKMKPLTKKYERRKTRLTGRSQRDLRLTGALLDTLQPRYADDHKAIGQVSRTKENKIKASLYREDLLFSPEDQAVMHETAVELLDEQVTQIASGDRARLGFSRTQSLFRRSQGARR